MSDSFGPATLALGSAMSAFTTMLPKITDIRKANPEKNPEFAADVRMAEIAAVTVAVGFGAIVSSLSGSAAPLVVVAIMCVILLSLYETTLRADRPLEIRRSESV